MEERLNLQAIRNDICNWSYITCVICGIPVTIAGALRDPVTDWQWMMAKQFAFFSVLFFIIPFRNRIPYNLRAGYLVFMFVIVGTIGLSKFGLVSGSIPILVVAPTLAMILFGFQVGICVVGITLALTLLVAVEFTTGYQTYNVELAAHVTRIPNWIVFLMVTLLCMIVPITAIKRIEGHLSKALALSIKNQDELEQLVCIRTKELENAKQEAESLARTDPLTGINNRRAFYELGHLIDDQARRLQRPYSVLMLDIDFFKSVNDNWGHDGGDRVLVFVSDLISHMSRSSDVIGRLGGFSSLCRICCYTPGHSMQERGCVSGETST